MYENAKILAFFSAVCDKSRFFGPKVLKITLIYINILFKYNSIIF